LRYQGALLFGTLGISIDYYEQGHSGLIDPNFPVYLLDVIDFPSKCIILYKTHYNQKPIIDKPFYATVYNYELKKL
jgi:hypothetical protein